MDFFESFFLVVQIARKLIQILQESHFLSSKKFKFWHISHTSLLSEGVGIDYCNRYVGRCWCCVDERATAVSVCRSIDYKINNEQQRSDVAATDAVQSQSSHRRS